MSGSRKHPRASPERWMCGTCPWVPSAAEEPLYYGGLYRSEQIGSGRNPDKPKDPHPVESQATQIHCLILKCLLPLTWSFDFSNYSRDIIGKKDKVTYDDILRVVPTNRVSKESNFQQCGNG